MNILITGGCGFIGSNLTNKLMKSEDNKIIILDNLSRIGAKLNKKWFDDRYKNNKNLKIFVEDIRDLDAVKKYIKDQDLVFHIAGQVAVTKSISNPIRDFENNARGTLNILESIRKSNNDPILLFTSTNKVYGDLNRYNVILKNGKYDFEDLKDGINEFTPLDFHSPYGCSVGAADSYVKDYHRIYGMKTIVFRMSCIYGPRQFGNEDQGWIAHFIISSILNRKLKIYGDGKQVRDILFIEDLLKAMTSAIHNINKTKGEVYNIGGGSRHVISLLELVEILEDKLNRKIKLEFQDWRPGDQKVYYSNISKAKKDFNWIPEIQKKDGLHKVINWATENLKLIKSFY